MTVAIADIDGLKLANDEHGHATGDALLAAVAQALSASCRISDSAYRIGGDEFALLLPGAGKVEYGALQLRLGELLTEVGTRFFGAGVSIGASHTPEDGSRLRALVRVADERMYAEKEAHRAA